MPSDQPGLPGVKLVLDTFESKSSGDALFPGGADDTLADAIMDAGWSVDFKEGDYRWTGVHPTSGAASTTWTVTFTA